MSLLDIIAIIIIIYILIYIIKKAANWSNLYVLQPMSKVVKVCNKLMDLTIGKLIQIRIPEKSESIHIDENLQEQSDIQQNIELYPYKEVQLLTPNEHFFFQSVKEIFKANGLFLCPKVRMEDFIWTDWETYNLTWQQEQAARNRIKSRHIDFLICDEDMRIQGGIELDDSSHYDENAQKKDNFKDNVYQKTGFRCFRVKVQFYDNNNREETVKQVQQYYINCIRQIISVINLNHRYCRVQRKIRKG